MKGFHKHKLASESPENQNNKTRQAMLGANVK
jgi:hypothetical protein